ACRAGICGPTAPTARRSTCRATRMAHAGSAPARGRTPGCSRWAGCLPTKSARLRLHIGRVGASLGSYVPAVTDPPRGRLFGASARASYDWARVKITPALSWLRLAEGQSAGSHRTSDLQLGLTIEWPVP